jgi:hypothetical protein
VTRARITSVTETAADPIRTQCLFLDHLTVTKARITIITAMAADPVRTQCLRLDPLMETKVRIMIMATAVDRIRTRRLPPDRLVATPAEVQAGQAITEIMATMVTITMDMKADPKRLA